MSRIEKPLPPTATVSEAASGDHSTAVSGNPTHPVEVEFFGDDIEKSKPKIDTEEARISKVEKRGLQLEKSLRNTRWLLIMLFAAVSGVYVVDKNKDEILAGMYGAADALLDGLESSKISEIEVIEKTYTESVTAENGRHEKLIADLADNLTKAVEESIKSHDSEKAAILAAYEAAMAEIRVLDEAIAKMEQARDLMAQVKPEVATEIETEDIKPKIEERQKKQTSADKNKSDSLLVLEGKIEALNRANEEDLKKAFEQHAAELLLIKEARERALKEVEAKIAVQSASSNRKIDWVNGAAEFVGASQGSWARLNSYKLQAFDDANEAAEGSKAKESTKTEAVQALYGELRFLNMLNCDDNRGQAVYVLECANGMPTESGIFNMPYTCNQDNALESDGRFVVHVEGKEDVNAGIMCKYGADGVFATTLQGVK